MCADLVLRLGVKKVISKTKYMRIYSDFLFHFSDSEAPFISQTGVLS